MKNIIIIAFLAVPVNVFPQASVDSVLANVERNNTTLSAFHNSIEASKIGNKTGNLPLNPEVEFNYLWGNPTAIGNRTDISIRQSFEFPTVYTYRSHISNLKNEQANLEYQRKRKEIHLQARLLCVELTYQNALIAEYSKRLHNARQIADTYVKKFERGETNILEFNKAQVHLLNLSKDIETMVIERTALLADLERLNGGIFIPFTDSVFLSQQLIPDFEEWYSQAEQNNPVLLWLRQELVIIQKQKQLQVAQILPKFYSGYMSEKVAGQHFQGVTIGVTIPLWENKNTVKFASAKVSVVERIQADAKIQFYHEMRALHTKTISLQNSANSYRNEMTKFSNQEHLAKALNKGEISLGDYFIELSLYYESLNKLIEMERSMNAAYYELIKFK